MIQRKRCSRVWTIGAFLDEDELGIHDSALIVSRNGGNWRALAAQKDVDGYNGYDILRACMKQGVNVLLFTPDMIHVAPFLQFCAHKNRDSKQSRYDSRDLDEQSSLHCGIISRSFNDDKSIRRQDEVGYEQEEEQ